MLFPSKGLYRLRYRRSDARYDEARAFGNRFPPQASGALYDPISCKVFDRAIMPSSKLLFLLWHPE